MSERVLDTGAARPWLTLVGPVGVVALWLLFGDCLRSAPAILPSVQETIASLWRFCTEPRFMGDVGSTIGRWVAGYLIAIVAAIPLGLLLGSSPRAYRSSEFVIEFFRSLPVTSLFPIYLLIFGVLGEGSKVAMIVTAGLFPALIATIHGVWNSPPQRREMAQVFGAKRWQIFRRVTFFDALGSAAIGARTSLSITLVVCILTEFWIGTTYGVGARLFEAYSRSNPAEMFAIIFVLGMMGFVANSGFLTVERRLLFWTRH